MNKPISFEIAKLLKEKGFPQINNIKEGNENFINFNWYNEDGIYNSNYKLKTTVIAPTILEVIMWLYEKHNTWICVSLIPFEQSNMFEYSISKLNETVIQNGVFETPQESYEEAIKYCLETVIK